ncbi:uncharacterized protein PG986_013941 [Apiospora aurea]|uniref:3-beta hydroxysteroid dehydrogenase/isomerase domain-containing protein n=1 Tax=Apiospora aurea TaxID=335848 RepID=A0ABR1PXA5_9PEZI
MKEYTLLDWLTAGAYIAVALLVAYLARINYLLKGTPEEVRKLTDSPWQPAKLKEIFEKLRTHPVDYTANLPPRQSRRYIVTGGSGLVGGFIVLQLLARGTPPQSIRIIDIRKTERSDFKTGPATKVGFVQTDITSRESVRAAFGREWHPSVSRLPLTVFHTAAVIIPSDRSKFVYAFPERVNVAGTQNVLDAAEAAGADVVSVTSSASIAIRPIEPFVGLGRLLLGEWPRYFWQVLDCRDFFGKPLRPHDEFFGNYPATKAVAERAVCAANREGFRTGCIRPANGVYGSPADNILGDPLARAVMPTWATHIVQSFVHGANVAVAHLHHEAALLRPDCPQAGRPFVVTDPNPPIAYNHMYTAIRTLSIHPFMVLPLPPAVMLLMAHAIEWWSVLPYKFPRLKGVIPAVRGDARYLKPGLFSICTHLVATNDEAARPGMVQEILEWNVEHAGENGQGYIARKAYTTSVSLADHIQKLGTLSNAITTSGRYTSEE